MGRPEHGGGPHQARSAGGRASWCWWSSSCSSRSTSASALAREIGVPANRITAILHGRRAITADTALRLAARFGTTAEFWMNLQVAHDLAAARQAGLAA